MAEFVREGHEDEAAQAGLHIFLGGIFGEACEGRGHLGFEGFESGGDGNFEAMDVKIFRKSECVLDALGTPGDAFIAFVGLYAIVALTYGFFNYRCPRCKSLIRYKPTTCRRCEAQLG
jgi:hypothetical protein